MINFGRTLTLMFPDQQTVKFLDQQTVKARIWSKSVRTGETNHGGWSTRTIQQHYENIRATTGRGYSYGLQIYGEPEPFQK